MASPLTDSMTYPEELIDFPNRYDIVQQAEFFLLATLDSFSSTMPQMDGMDFVQQVQLWKMFTTA